MIAKVRIIELEFDGDEAAIGGALASVAELFGQGPRESSTMGGGDVSDLKGSDAENPAGGREEEREAAIGEEEPVPRREEWGGDDAGDDIEAIRAEEEETREFEERRNDELEAAGEMPIEACGPARTAGETKEVVCQGAKPMELKGKRVAQAAAVRGGSIKFAPFTDAARREVARLKTVEKKTYHEIEAMDFPCVDGTRRRASTAMIADAVKRHGEAAKKDSGSKSPSLVAAGIRTACVIGMEALGVAVLQVLREHGVESIICSSRSGDYYRSTVRTFHRLGVNYFFNVRRPPEGHEVYIVTDGTVLPAGYAPMSVEDLLGEYPECSFAEAARAFLPKGESA